MGLHVAFPPVLASCPGRQYWEPFAGRPYLVFVDESFSNRFFEFSSLAGYFCHAVVGIPQERHDALRTAILPTFERFRVLTEAGATEFKHRDFERIAVGHRKELALELASALRAHGGFIGGFYTPTASFLLEGVRFQLVGERAALPEPVDDEAMATAIKRLRTEEKGPGNATTIGRLLHLPVAAVGSLLLGFGCPYSVVYDPREKRENEAVRGYIEALAREFADLGDEALGRFGGLRTDRTSEEEIGLQLADLAVGEVRRFFQANPQVLEYGARRELITPWSAEPVETVEDHDGVAVKTGAMIAMPEALQSCFLYDDPSGRSVLSCFADVFASGMLTCYAATGTPRDLLVFERQMWDQADLDLWSMALTQALVQRRKP